MLKSLDFLYADLQYSASKMRELRGNICFILPFYYNEDKNVAQGNKKVCAIHGQDVVQRWFWLFRYTHFSVKSVKNAACSGQLLTKKVDEIIVKVEQHQHVSSHDISNKLNNCHQTVLNQLKKGYKKARSLRATRIDAKEFTRIYFHLWNWMKDAMKSSHFDHKRLTSGGEKWTTYSNA